MSQMALEPVPVEPLDPVDLVDPGEQATGRDLLADVAATVVGLSVKRLSLGDNDNSGLRYEIANGPGVIAALKGLLSLQTQTAAKLDGACAEIAANGALAEDRLNAESAAREKIEARLAELEAAALKAELLEKRVEALEASEREAREAAREAASDAASKAQAETNAALLAKVAELEKRFDAVPAPAKEEQPAVAAAPAPAHVTEEKPVVEAAAAVAAASSVPAAAAPSNGADATRLDEAFRELRELRGALDGATGRLREIENTGAAEEAAEVDAAVKIQQLWRKEPSARKVESATETTANFTSLVESLAQRQLDAQSEQRSMARRLAALEEETRLERAAVADDLAKVNQAIEQQAARHEAAGKATQDHLADHDKKIFDLVNTAGPPVVARRPSAGTVDPPSDVAGRSSAGTVASRRPSAGTVASRPEPEAATVVAVPPQSYAASREPQSEALEPPASEAVVALQRAVDYLGAELRAQDSRLRGADDDLSRRLHAAEQDLQRLQTLQTAGRRASSGRQGSMMGGRRPSIKEAGRRPSISVTLKPQEAAPAAALSLEAAPIVAKPPDAAPTLIVHKPAALSLDALSVAMDDDEDTERRLAALEALTRQLEIAMEQQQPASPTSPHAFTDTDELGALATRYCGLQLETSRRQLPEAQRRALCWPPSAEYFPPDDLADDVNEAELEGRKRNFLEDLLSGASSSIEQYVLKRPLKRRPQTTGGSRKRHQQQRAAKKVHALLGKFAKYADEALEWQSRQQETSSSRDAIAKRLSTDLRDQLRSLEEQEDWLPRVELPQSPTSPTSPPPMSPTAPEVEVGALATTRPAMCLSCQKPAFPVRSGGRALSGHRQFVAKNSDGSKDTVWRGGFKMPYSNDFYHVTKGNTPQKPELYSATSRSISVATPGDRARHVRPNTAK